MEVSAKVKGVRISPRKVQLVATQIRGRGLEEAINILCYSDNKSAKIVKRLLDSAIANAEHNHAADIDDLKVSAIIVNKGKVLKRIKPRAKGRADRILKRSSHIEVTLSDKG
jgi:large subunit ribosomal protein L22